MKKSVFKTTLYLFLCASMIFIKGCGSESDDTGFVINIDGTITTNNVVPEKETLLANLEDAGYTISEYTSVDGSSLTIDRIIAEKGNRFIDITYGLTEEAAGEIFNAYCDIYKTDGDYYILAQNLNFVYCVSDKKTFSKAGFTSTSNIGIQYIND